MKSLQKSESETSENARRQNVTLHLHAVEPRAQPSTPQSTGSGIESVLLMALENHTRTPWRAVCPGVAVERIEPYRTMVLPSEVLGALRCWRDDQNQQSERVESVAAPFTLNAILHAPLASESA